MMRTSSSSPAALGPQHEARDDRHERDGEDQRRPDGGDHGGRQRPVHPALDAGHAEEGQEDGHHDQGREGDRTTHLHRRGERALRLRARTGDRQAMEDVLHHDDRGVHQQADGDGHAAQGHGVDPDAGLVQEDAGQGDGERDGEGHEQGRSQIAEQREQHHDDEEGPEQHGASDAAERRRHEQRLVVDHPEGHALRAGSDGCR